MSNGASPTLGAQNLAALGAAATDDGAPAGGCHAAAEPMRAGSSDFARLICSLHDILLKISGWAVGRPPERCGTPGLSGCLGLPPPLAREGGVALALKYMEQATYTPA